MTSIPAVLALFKRKGQLTSRELAAVMDKTFGSDAVTRCRQLGLPIEGIGLVEGSRLPRKLYTVDICLLWLAIEEAIQQINRYARILNSREASACRIFRNPATWMEHVRRIQKIKSKAPPKERG